MSEEKQERLAKIIKIATILEIDIANDVKNFEGKAFNGRNVAEFMGIQAACISALARLITALTKEVKNVNNS